MKNEIKGLYPMFPAPIPLCAIEWIDRVGNPTPDDNPAVGLACLDQKTTSGYDMPTQTREFPVCEHHAKQIKGYWYFKGFGQ